MKKFGFTLAEVLVTLGIVGVIAALTIPTFTVKAQNQANASKLASTVSELENAMGLIITNDENANDLIDTDFWHVLSASSIQNSLGNYIKMNCTNNINSYYDNSQPFKKINGDSHKMLFDVVCQLKNGAIFAIDDNPIGIEESVAKSLGLSAYALGSDIYIDVNGRQEPNRYGRDIFVFAYGNDGILYPNGGIVYSQIEGNGTNQVWNNSSASASHICTNSNKGDGRGCTARLVENNYKVDY